MLRRALPSAATAAAAFSASSSFSLRATTNLRFCSTATTTTTNPSSTSSSSEASPNPTTTEQQQQKEQFQTESAEHDRFMNFVSTANFTRAPHCRPSVLCSSARIDRERRTNPKAVQLAQGRGLIATSDCHAGTVLATAPLLASCISADGLWRKATSQEQMEQFSHFPEPLRDALLLVWHSLPSASVARRVAFATSGIKDDFVAMQAHLALCLAAERCNEQSVYAPYFESLPHPAVDDKIVVEVFKDFLDDDLDAYGGHCKDYNDMLVGLHDEWMRNAIELSGKKAEDIFVPPMSILQWAWRTVISRQTLLPLYGKPVISKDDQLRYGLQTHFLNWASLHQGEQEAELYPVLMPFFDLADHGPVGNVRLDVVVRPISPMDAAMGYTHEQDAAVSKLVQEASRNAEKVHKNDRGVMSRMKRSVSRAFGIGAHHYHEKDGDERETAAFVELQAVTELRAGMELNIRFATDTDDRPFSLYRFGFYPMSFEE